MLGGKFVFDAVRKGYSAGPVFSTMVEFFLRFLQFIFGIAVIGLYAQDLVHSRKAGDGMDSKWVRPPTLAFKTPWHPRTLTN
jgi:hypothetical protein